MEKIKFHPIFVLYVFVCTYFGWFNAIYFYIVAMVLHEWGHYIVARRLGYNTNGMLFSIYGAGLKSNNCYKPRDDIMISIAGPLVSLILIIVTIVLWWLFPSIYVFTIDFVVCNFVILIFNIIPIYPLDGGRVLFAILNNRNGLNTRRVYRTNMVLCMVLGAIFIILFVVSVFYKTNINLLFIGMFLTLNPIFYDKNNYFTHMSAINKKSDIPCEVKTFRVYSTDIKKLYKYLSPHYICRFEICDGDSVTIVDEKDLLN